jgi:class 3 adenylate cyclase/pimeloyl-ACP methyl ester carboxylesterase
MEIRDTRYARAPDGAYIAYQVTGNGPIDIVWQFDFFGNVDIRWEQPDTGAWMRGLSGLGRLILHDRRGTGLSSRNVPLPNLETRVADLRAVLDEIGVERVVLMGFSEGGAPNAMFAATDPDRVHSLVWFAPSARIAWAPDYPWGVGPDYFAKDQLSLERWGTTEYGRAFAEAEALVGSEITDEDVATVSLISRHTATPDVARELSRIWWETDIRGVLPSVQVPAMLASWAAVENDVREMEAIASLMPRAKTVVFPGSVGRESFPEYLDAIREFVGIEQAPAELDTVLSTVLFTDIVGSTERQASLGDHGWKELVQRHHALVRDALTRWRGVENDTAGDGFYATFDGPARAIRCAQEVAGRVRDLGIQIRAGVHTGECELIDGKCGGITVSIGARVASNAGPSEVLISQTVKDLVAGSGLTFEDAGEHELKGVPDRWHLFRVVEG